jgi:tetratricopeptide (TPR) repeat protein
MIETNTTSPEFSLVAKGRELLDKGDLSSAVEYYGKAFDPESMDEEEARNMLIEARSHLSKKHLLEALESFEEALLMGTEVQRRQALDGIFTIGQIRSRLAALTAELKTGLKNVLGKLSPEEVGLVLIGDEENVVLVADEAAERIPGHLTRGGKISRLPQHLMDSALPVAADKCIAYADEDDVRYILDVATELLKARESQQSAG